MQLRFWNFTSETEGRRILHIEGDIAAYSWWGDEVTPQEFKKELFSAAGDIDVIINSNGGDVFAANEIYGMLKEYPGNVRVKIAPLAASAASVIAMAGDEVLISPVGMIFIHDPMASVFGNETELGGAIESLKAVKENIVTAYEKKTGLPRDEIAQLMAAETFIPATTAIKMGFADALLYEDDPKEATAFNRKEPVRITNAATRAMLDKIKATQEPPPAANSIPAEPLYQRLDLIQKTL